jgi:hypothetical protein
MDPNIEAPIFPLGGIAIGNGFTDAVSQTLVQAEVAWGMGLIDTNQRRQAETIQDEVRGQCLTLWAQLGLAGVGRKNPTTPNPTPTNS